jgi:hypothetical protein
MLSRASDALFLLRAYAIPEQSRISFDEESHTYFVDGIAVPCSVTGLLKAVDPEPFDGPARAAAIASKDIRDTKPEYLKTNDDGHAVKMTAEEIVAMWDRARDLGTDLHGHIEQYVNAFAEVEVAFQAVLEELEDEEQSGPWDATVDGDGAGRNVRRRLITHARARDGSPTKQRWHDTGDDDGDTDNDADDDDDSGDDGGKVTTKLRQQAAVDEAPLQMPSAHGEESGRTTYTAFDAWTRTRRARAAVSATVRACVRRGVNKHVADGILHLDFTVPYLTPLYMRRKHDPRRHRALFAHLDAMTVAILGEALLPAARQSTHDNAAHMAMFRRYWETQWLTGLLPFASELQIFTNVRDVDGPTHGDAQPACDTTHAVAGSVDFIGLNLETGKFVIMDWKRCKIYGCGFSRAFRGRRLLSPLDAFEDTKLNHWSLQVNVYRMILEAAPYNMAVERMLMVVIMTESGQTEAVEFCHSRDDAAKVLLTDRMHAGTPNEHSVQRTTAGCTS